MSDQNLRDYLEAVTSMMMANGVPDECVDHVIDRIRDQLEGFSIGKLDYTWSLPNNHAETLSALEAGRVELEDQFRRQTWTLLSCLVRTEVALWSAENGVTNQ